MSTTPIDYDAIAKQHGGVVASSSAASAVDYDAIAAQHGGTVVDGQRFNLSPKETQDVIGAFKPTDMSKSAPLRAVQGFNSSFGIPESVQDNPSEALEGIKLAVQHPQLLMDSVKEIGKGILPAQNAAYDQGRREISQPGVSNKIAGVLHMVESGIPFIGPSLVNADNRIAQGDYAGAGGSLIGTIGQVAVPAVSHTPTPGSIEAAQQAAGVMQPPPPGSGGLMSGRMQEVPPGEQFSRGDVLRAARANGVNLDLAQATDSGLAHTVKKANRLSLAAAGTYDEAQTRNLNALQEWADKTAKSYAPDSASREVIGGQLQQALKNHLDARSNAATQLYSELDKNVGNVKPDASSIYDKAKQIVAENEAYYDKNPALKQSRAWQIVNDLADRAENTQPTTGNVVSKIVDEAGNPYSRQVTQGPVVKPDTWTDLQKLRTDLMSQYRSPEIVGSRAEGWLKQLTGTIDDSMTGAGSGMSGADLAKFRQANDIWSSIKSTYDNPQSPMYHAVRAASPSQVPAMLSKGTPELAQQVRQTLGSLEGPFQRQFVEKLLNGKDGATLDLSGLNQRLRGIQQDHLEAMIGKDGAKNLRMLGKVAAKVTADSNPSGTAKHIIPYGEVAGTIANPVLGGSELGINYLGGKLMNSPSVVNYLTRPKP